MQIINSPPTMLTLMPLLSRLAVIDLADATPTLQALSAKLGSEAGWHLPPCAGGSYTSLDDLAAIRRWITRGLPTSLTALPGGTPMQIGVHHIGIFHAPELDRQLANYLAPLLATALDRWRLQATIQRVQAEKHMLVTLSQLTANLTDLRSVLQVTYDSIRSVVPLDAFAGTIYNPISKAHVLSLLVDGDDVWTDTLVGPLSNNLVSWIIRNLKPLAFDDLAAELPEYPQIAPLHYGTSQLGHSWLGVPMLLGDGRPVGSLSIQHQEASMYSAHDRDFMTEVATQVAIAIEKAMLLGERDQIIATLEAQVDLGEELGQPHDVGSALEGSLTAVEHAFPDQVYILILVDAEQRVLAEWVKENGQFFRDASLGQIVTPHGLPSYVMTARRPLLVNTDAEWNAMGMSDELIGDPNMPTTEGIIAAPLLTSNGTILGCVSVQSYQPYAFTEQQSGLLGSMAHHIALAVENARLIEQSQRQVQALEGAYDQLQQTQTQLVESERRRAIGDIAAGVAHDFNNLLGTILGAAQLIDFAENVDQARTEAAVIELAARDASLIVRRIQEFTRTRLPQAHTVVAIDHLIHSAIDLTRPRWRDQARLQGIALQVQLNLTPVPSVLGVAAELREVLVNLIGNAVDAMPHGGKLCFHTYSQAEQVMIVVTDTGEGISPDVLAHIGEPFYTTKGKCGSGLGLAVSQAVIRRHGGQLKLTSDGTGTTVTITLPSSTESALPVESSAHRQPARQGMILLVEDDHQLRSVLVRMLSSGGYTVVAVDDGPAALRELAAAPFDLVVTDLGLPGMSGWDVSEATHRGHPYLPVLLLTGWGDQIAAVEAARHNVAGVLAKPVEHQMLLDTVARLVPDRMHA